MHLTLRFLTFYFLIFTLLACKNNTSKKDDNENENTMYPISEPVYEKGSYGYDAKFLREHAGEMIELKNEDAKVLLSAAYQGRVFTSTASGDSGISFGWINYNLLEDSVKKTQFNPVGGEERFWLGPEGGQYSLYFKKGDPFDFAHWQVPALIDTAAYKVNASDKTSATFSHNASLTNYTGTIFNIAITRKIELLDKNAVAQKLNATIPETVKAVAYESTNQLKNAGNNTWKKDSGLLSIWLLGMFTPTEETKVIIPFSPSKNVRSFITDDYFGKIDSSRLMIKDSVLYFRCDGKARSKIGINPVIAKPFVCSYDFMKNVLTIVLPEVHKDSLYVNSKWELQKKPFTGDVINSYNDGPLQNGSQMGPFYEIESSSPARQLQPGETQEYRQATIHLQGDYATLKNLLQQMIQVNLDDIKNW